MNTENLSNHAAIDKLKELVDKIDISREEESRL